MSGEDTHQYGPRGCAGDVCGWGAGQPSCWGFDSWNDCVCFGECRGLYVDRAASEERVTIFRYRCRHSDEWFRGVWLRSFGRGLRAQYIPGTGYAFEGWVRGEWSCERGVGAYGGVGEVVGLRGLAQPRALRSFAPPDGRGRPSPRGSWQTWVVELGVVRTIGVGLS